MAVGKLFVDFRLIGSLRNELPHGSSDTAQIRLLGLEFAQDSQDLTRKVERLLILLRTT